MNQKKSIKKKIAGICPICGDETTGFTRKKRYCSDSCRQIAYKKRHHLYSYQKKERSELEKTQLQNSKLKKQVFEYSKSIYYLKQANKELASRVNELMVLIQKMMGEQNEKNLITNKTIANEDNNL